jgi:hypothetical protein
MIHDSPGRSRVWHLVGTATIVYVPFLFTVKGPQEDRRTRNPKTTPMEAEGRGARRRGEAHGASRRMEPQGPGLSLRALASR